MNDQKSQKAMSENKALYETKKVGLVHDIQTRRKLLTDTLHEALMQIEQLQDKCPHALWITLQDAKSKIEFAIEDVEYDG